MHQGQIKDDKWDDIDEEIIEWYHVLDSWLKDSCTYLNNVRTPVCTLFYVDSKTVGAMCYRSF